MTVRDCGRAGILIKLSNKKYYNTKLLKFHKEKKWVQLLGGIG